MSEYVVRVDEYGESIGVCHGPTDLESAITAAKNEAEEYTDGKIRIEPSDYIEKPSEAWHCEGYVKAGIRYYLVVEDEE